MPLERTNSDLLELIYAVKLLARTVDTTVDNSSKTLERLATLSGTLQEHHEDLALISRDLKELRQAVDDAVERTEYVRRASELAGIVAQAKIENKSEKPANEGALTVSDGHLKVKVELSKVWSVGKRLFYLLGASSGLLALAKAVWEALHK